MPTASVQTPFLDVLNGLAEASKGDSTGSGGKIIRRLIHGPLADLIVNITPNPYDNMLLSVLRATIPPN